MSIFANNIVSPNIVSLENIVSSQSTQIQDLIDLYSNKKNRSYDQTTKQNAIISFDDSSKLYRFEIKKNQDNKENDVFMYQIWEKNSEFNSDRKYQYVPLRYWIMEYNLNKFTPTTLIEINNVFYPTVMVKADVEGENCVFYFDSRSIYSSQPSQPLPKIGSYNDIRFDIDSIYMYTNYNNLNINITLEDGTVILNGTLNLRSVDSNNRLFEVISINSNSNTYTPNTSLVSIKYGYQNLYTSLFQPFLVSYYGTVKTANNFNDMNNILFTNGSPNYNGNFELSNQLLFVQSNNNVISIPTPVDNGDGSSISLGLDGNYYTTNNYNALYSQGTIVNGASPVNNDYDITSGILINNYAINSAKNIVNNNLNNIFKFWYSTRHNAWNFISYYIFNGQYQITGAGPTVLEYNASSNSIIMLGNTLNVTISN